MIAREHGFESVEAVLIEPLTRGAVPELRLRSIEPFQISLQTKLDDFHAAPDTCLQRTVQLCSRIQRGPVKGNPAGKFGRHWVIKFLRELIIAVASQVII